MDEIKEKFIFRKNIYAPRERAEPAEQPICKFYERCKNCRFPGVGFTCDHGDGTCLYTDVFGYDAAKSEKV